MIVDVSDELVNDAKFDYIGLWEVTRRVSEKLNAADVEMLM